MKSKRFSAGVLTVNALLSVFLLLSSKVFAQANNQSEFLSIAIPATILYDAPSLSAEKLYVASVNLPLEVMVKVVGWVKVRDHHGYLAWVEDKNLSSKRFVIVNSSVGNIYQSPNQASSLVFQARQDVVLEWLGMAANRWVKVRHQDGQAGYIRADQVWGV
jgi:SH3-like domain-containing protein